MPPEMVRFTAYLSLREREQLEQMASEQHTSANFVLREAVRAWLGLSAGFKASQLSQVTTRKREQ